LPEIFNGIMSITFRIGIVCILIATPEAGKVRISWIKTYSFSFGNWYKVERSLLKCKTFQSSYNL